MDDIPALPRYAYRTILFDFDGTLVPSLELWLEALKVALSSCGIELSETAILQRCFYRSFDSVAMDLGIPPEREFPRLVEAQMIRAFAKIQLFPMVKKLLDSCKQTGFRLGLVTSTSMTVVTNALSRLELDGYFDTKVTGGEVTHHKPHAEPVQLALRRLTESPAHTLFVGNSAVDMLAGHAAGTRTALFVSERNARFRDIEAGKPIQPDFTFSHHAELIAYLMPKGPDGAGDSQGFQR